MFRIFCDVCGIEIPSKEAGKRFFFEKGRISAEIMVAVDKTWNAGHICEKCLMDCIQTGDKKLK